jgi:hypothetical protein
MLVVVHHKVWGDTNFLAGCVNNGNILKKRMIAFGIELNNQDATTSSLPYTIIFIFP